MYPKRCILAMSFERTHCLTQRIQFLIRHLLRTHSVLFFGIKTRHHHLERRKNRFSETFLVLRRHHSLEFGKLLFILYYRILSLFAHALQSIMKLYRTSTESACMPIEWFS